MACDMPIFAYNIALAIMRHYVFSHVEIYCKESKLVLIDNIEW